MGSTGKRAQALNRAQVDDTMLKGHMSPQGPVQLLQAAAGLAFSHAMNLALTAGPTSLYQCILYYCSLLHPPSVNSVHCV